MKSALSRLLFSVDEFTLRVRVLYYIRVCSRWIAKSSEFAAELAIRREQQSRQSTGKPL